MFFLQKRKDEPPSEGDDNSKGSLRNEARLDLNYTDTFRKLKLNYFFCHAKNEIIKIVIKRCSRSLYFSFKILLYLILLS